MLLTTLPLRDAPRAHKPNYFLRPTNQHCALVDKDFSMAAGAPRILWCCISRADILPGAVRAASAYWFYLAKPLVGAWLIWECAVCFRNALGGELGSGRGGGGGIAAWVGITGDWTAQNSLWIKLGILTREARGFNLGSQVQFWRTNARSLGF